MTKPSRLALSLPSLLSVLALGLAAVGARAQKPAPEVSGSAFREGAPKAGAKGKAAAPGSPVVTVGSKRIERRAVDTLVTLMVRQRHGGKEAPPEEVAVLKKLVASNLIGQELLDLECEAKKIQVDPKQTDSLFGRFRAGFPSDQAFAAALKAAGDTEKSLREKLEKQLVREKLLATQLTALQRPTEEEIKAFFEKNKTRFPINDSLRACQIVLTVGKTTKADEEKKKKTELEKIRAELLKDSADAAVFLIKFTQVAARISETPEKKAGGDLKRFHPGDFFPEFQKEVGRLKVGQLSPVFRTPLGYHLVFLTERNDGKMGSYRLQVMQQVTAQKSSKNQEALKKYLQTLAAKYPVTFLDPAYRDQSPQALYSGAAK